MINKIKTMLCILLIFIFWKIGQHFFYIINHQHQVGRLFYFINHAQLAQRVGSIGELDGPGGDPGDQLIILVILLGGFQLRFHNVQNHSSSGHLRSAGRWILV